MKTSDELGLDAAALHVHVGHMANLSLHSDLIVLGIESSCDETAAAVVQRNHDGTVDVLANLIHSQLDHSPFGGVVPEIAARAHMERIDDLVDQALKSAQERCGDEFQLDAVAATAGPGLIGGVMVGLAFAKGFSLARNLPLYAINHLEGHALSPRLTQKVEFPYLLLLVSGGHCQILSVLGVGQYVRLGTTIDDAAGEAFDKIAKVLGLGYPGGPALEACARDGVSGHFHFALPKGLPGAFDFSFSGLKTAAARFALSAVASEQDRADLCLAVQTAIATQLVDRVGRAMEAFANDHGQARLVVAGGVAANQTLRHALQTLAVKKGFDFVAPPMAYCTDNAAMIALAGIEHILKDGALMTDMELALAAQARPRWPLDEVTAGASPVHKTIGRKGAKA